MIQLTEAEFRWLTDDNMGLCRNCGEPRECCEPDAENYECEYCEQNEVFGVEQLLLRGELEIVN